MEKFKHSNDIEIKLLVNKRFIYANRKQNIVITAEHMATEITVLFPDEYEEYSKRVDFINSQGKEWTEGLYTPEFKNYKPGTSKTRFHFSLPTEVTTEGELRMQFLAYLPDESMTTVPFEIIPIDIQNGMLAFKRSSKSNPDLLILAANYSTQALFNSQKAVAKSEQALANSEYAVKVSDETAAGLVAETERAIKAEADITAALNAESDRAQLAESQIAGNLSAEIERARGAETAITAALNAETARATAAEQTNAQAIETESQRATAAENAIAADLSAEILRATNAEDNLGIALNTETTARIQGDADNKAATDAETLRAQAAEDALTAALTAETARAQLAEQLNSNAIQAETSRATAAENDLQSQLNTEKTRAVAAENNLQGQLTAEVTRATQSEAGISAALSAEVTRAKAAEQMNTTAINNETSRATAAESALGARIDSEVPAALSAAKAYADQLTEQVRIDGTEYIGSVDESDLPATAENGNLYWITDFNITQPGHSGSAIWNGKTNCWDFSIDRYKHQDNETIVARESDGALKVADTDEINLMPDTTDYSGTVRLGFKAMIRSIIRKIKGLFQKSEENAQAINTETNRAQTVENDLSSAIYSEEMRARAAEQANEHAIFMETDRAQHSENMLTQMMHDEVMRAQWAEQANERAIMEETARAQSAEGELWSRIDSEETRARAAEQSNAGAIAAETTRAKNAENGLSAALSSEITARQSGDTANAQAIAAETTRAQGVEAGKVDKIPGKGLSTEDYTTAEKSKLLGIEDGANKYIHPTTHPPAIIAQDASNRFVTDIEKGTWNGKADKTVATQSLAGLMSAADKTKLDGITPGEGGIPVFISGGLGTAYTVTAPEFGTVFSSGLSFIMVPHVDSYAGTVTLSLNGTTAKPIVRFSTSDGFFANIGSYTQGLTKDRPVLIVYDSTNNNFVVATRPLISWTDLLNAPTVVQATGSGTSNLMSQKAVTDSLVLKVDKVTGKQLSTEDYTTAEKSKLAGIENNANNYSHPSSHPPSIITQDASNRFVTDTEKSTWNGKAPANHASTATTYGAATKANYGHIKFYGNANGDSTELLANPTYEHYYNNAFDCSSYTTPGRVYMNHNRSGAGAIVNGALGNINDRFCLEVFSVPADTTTILQRYVSMMYGREFVRKYVNSAWGAWQEMAFTTAVTQSSNGLMSAADKTKLDGIEDGANKYAHPASHPPSIIAQDASNRFVTDTEKTAWNGKAEKTTATQTANGLMSSTDKTKLDGIETGANKYTHPTTHPPSIIAQDASNRFVTDPEKSTWNGKAPTPHASTATTYGVGDVTNYGHVKLSSVEGGTSYPTGDTARRYNYTSVASVTDLDLNSYVYEGSYTLYSIPSTALNFPSGWGTGTANTAYLEVRRFYMTSAVHQTLYKRSTTQRWVRMLSSTTWSAWVEVDEAVANKANSNQRNLGGSSLTAGYTFGGGASANYSNASTAIGIYSAADYYMATSMGIYAESYEAACAFGPYARAKATQATALGYSTNANYASSTAVGQLAATTAVNQVQLGASGSTVYYYAIASRSDERDKADIEDCRQGLDFIKKLKPRQFLWDYREDYYERVDKGGGEIEVIKHERDGSKKRSRKHYGLIAQEVKQLIEETGEDFAGYQDHKVSGGEDVLSLSYMEFIAPMIKAIQEQQSMIETMQAEINGLKTEIKELKKQ